MSEAADDETAYIEVEPAKINKILQAFNQISLDVSRKDKVHPYLFVVAAVCFAYGCCREDGQMSDSGAKDTIKSLSDFAGSYTKTFRIEEPEKTEIN